MKKIITITALLIFSSQLNAQMYMQMGAGLNVKQSYPVVELNLGGIIKDKVILSAGMQAVTTNNVREGGAAFQGRLGYQIKAGGKISFTPFTGYYYHLKSNDQKGLNSSGVLYGSDISFQTNIEQLRFYLSATKIGTNLMASAGIKFLFINNSGISCR